MAFGALKMPLGGLLGPSEGVLDGLGIPKAHTYMVLQMQAFGTLKPLGPIMAPLGLIWSQKSSPELLQLLSKKWPKPDPKHYLTNNKNRKF